MTLTRLHALHAAALAHRAWFALGARHSGGDVYREAGVWWALPASGSLTATLAFPWLRPRSGASALDAILGRIRTEGRVRGTSCWTLRPEHRTELGALLVARGFEVGWQAHWMARDLRAPRAPRPAPAGVEIAQVEGIRAWDRREDADPEGPEWRRTARRNQELVALRPQRVWEFGAFRGGGAVGGTTLFVPPELPDVALLDDVAVAPEERRRGIGSAVTDAACSHARALGCRVVVLNATPEGERLYPRVGFVSLSRGQTWWMHRPAMDTPPTTTQVRLAEALARGDVRALECLRVDLDPDAPLPSGSTPLQIAATFAQAGAARWLLDRGARFDVLAGWDLGWHERVAQELRRSRERASAPDARTGATLLHDAVVRDDPALLRTLLEAGADPTVRDATHDSTPLGWARFMGRSELAALLEAVGAEA